MKDRKGNKAGRKAKLTVVSRSELSALRGCFAEREEWLRPMLGLVENARASIDELMSETARAFVEQLVVLSAQELAGAKHLGRHAGDVCWHGTQAGRIVLAERKLSVKRPRLRRRGPAGKEVAVPVYERVIAEPRLGARVRDILVEGVSTRKYAGVLPKMAGTVSISRSSVSRKFVQAATRSLQTLMSRRSDEIDILAMWIDGIVVDSHHILAVVGVDTQGNKHLLSLAQGSSENARVPRTCLGV